MTSPSSGSLSVDDVTVVVVTYNSAHCIADLAPALAGLPHVVIVDNASADDTVVTVARALPNARIHRCARNLGFGAANNIALRAATTRYALLLNPDCLPGPDFMDGMLEVAAAFPDAAILAPHILRGSNRVEISYRWPDTVWRSAGPAAEGPLCVGFVCGAAMLLNLPVMNDVGFFDEAFFLYYEDGDLCQRVFQQRKQIILAPSVAIHHHSRGSVRGPNRLTSEFTRGYHHVQSKLIYAGKHVGSSQARRLRTRTLLLALALVPLRLLVPNPRYLARLFGRIRGLWDFTATAPEAQRRPASSSGS